MKAIYPVILTQTNDEKNTVLVNVPDLEILTEGYGMFDAIEMARDAIGVHGISLEDAKQEIAQPSKISEIDIAKGAFAECGESTITLVDIDFLEYRRKVDRKSVRRNVTIPNWLNREAEKEGLNVSRVLQEALIERLGLQED